VLLIEGYWISHTFHGAMARIPVASMGRYMSAEAMSVGENKTAGAEVGVGPIMLALPG
jgi:hypothetical protein